jgi:hypothetical protein
VAVYFRGAVAVYFRCVHVAMRRAVRAREPVAALASSTPPGIPLSGIKANLPPQAAAMAAACHAYTWDSHAPHRWFSFPGPAFLVSRFTCAWSPAEAGARRTG